MDMDDQGGGCGLWIVGGNVLRECVEGMEGAMGGDVFIRERGK
jgi:hypothetical protein